MSINLLKEILNHNLDSGAAIVTNGTDGVHLANTWNSYIRLENDDTLYIPVGGMIKTEENLKENGKILLSVTNREIQGFNFPGTGVLIEGTGKIVTTGDLVEKTKESYPWIRGVLVVKIDKVEQKL